MIIHFGDSRALKSALETAISESILSGEPITETKLSVIFHRHKSYKVDPEWDYSRARTTWGWDSSTLRYFAKIDEYSCYLPETSPLFIKDINKCEDGEEIIHCTKLDLLRELNKLDIQVSKIKKMIEGDN